MSLSLAVHAAAPVASPARPAYLAESWDTDRGLPGFGVTAIAQTRDGYLWVATFDGLARFDGVTFALITHATTPEFPGKTVSSLFTDREGRLWAGSDKGIACLQNGHWRVYPDREGKPVNLATGFIEGVDGSIMATASGDRMLSLVQDRFVEHPVPPGIQYLRAFRDRGGDLWISGRHALARFENGHWQSIPLPPEIANDELAGAAAGGEGGVWVAGTAGLQKFQNGAWTKVPIPAATRFTRLVAFLEDSDGNLWVGDHSRGILQFRKDGQVLSFTRDDGLPSLAIRRLFEDREKNVWVATDGGGLARFRPRAVHMFDETQGLGEIVLDSVVETSTGAILAGSYGGGLFRFDPVRARFSTFVDHPGLTRTTEDSYALSVLEDSAGTIWTGVSGRGVFRIRGATVEATPLQPLGGASPKALFQDSRGAVWFGTRFGVGSYQAGQFQTYREQSGMPPADIIAIAEDRAKEIWVGGDVGLFRWRGSKFQRFVPPGLRSYERITSLYATDDGALWIGAEGRGLDRWRDGVLTNFGPAQGLPSTSVTSILEDGEGRLWLGTVRQGLLCIPRASFDKVVSGLQGGLDVVWLKKEDGLSTNQLRSGYQPSSWRSRDGRLWFASLKGLAMVEPGRVRRNPVIPPVHIEAVGISGRKVAVDPSSNIELEIPAGSRRLEVFYTALSLSEPERVRFQYSLEGLDPNWVDATERSARFGDLRPGDYVFRVRAANNDGVWNPEPASLKVHVAAFVWETWWFRLMAVAGLAVLTGVAVYGSQRWKLQVKTRQLQMEQELRRDVERLQEVLKTSEERFSKAFNASPLPMSIATMKEGRFIDVNQSFLDRTGCTREEVIGRMRSELGLWDDEMLLKRFQEGVERYGSVRGSEVFLRNRRGEIRTLLVSAEKIELEGVPCMLSVADDITERKLLQEQLSQSQKLESVGRLAGGIAHDFNNLLTVINGYSSLILSDPKRLETVPKRVELIRQAGERAAELTQQLLAFSRKQVIQPRPLNLNTLVSEMEAMLRRLLPENIEMVLRLDSSLGDVMADPGQIHQVLMNLAVNARDAMPHGGKLIMETANVDLDAQYVASHPEVQPGPSVLFGLSDTGLGMEQEVLQHIFEPFFTTKGVGAGTGLGLATVYGIVRQSGGWVWVYSEPGKGTSFKIYLPRIGASAASAAPERAVTTTMTGTETVLLVEDQDDVRSLAREVLESHGYHVLEAVNGAAALELAASYAGPIHLLLTDVVMPVMNGTELAARLVKLRPATKVLYTSGYTENVIVHQGVLKPGTSFVPKPLNPDVLVEKVRAVLGPPARD